MQRELVRELQGYFARSNRLKPSMIPFQILDLDLDLLGGFKENFARRTTLIACGDLEPGEAVTTREMNISFNSDLDFACSESNFTFKGPNLFQVKSVVEHLLVPGVVMAEECATCTYEWKFKYEGWMVSLCEHTGLEYHYELTLLKQACFK